VVFWNHHRVVDLSEEFDRCKPLLVVVDEVNSVFVDLVGSS